METRQPIHLPVIFSEFLVALEPKVSFLLKCHKVNALVALGLISETVIVLGMVATPVVIVFWALGF